MSTQAPLTSHDCRTDIAFLILMKSGWNRFCCIFDHCSLGLVFNFSSVTGSLWNHGQLFGSMFSKLPTYLDIKLETSFFPEVLGIQSSDWRLWELLVLSTPENRAVKESSWTPINFGPWNSRTHLKILALTPVCPVYPICRMGMIILPSLPWLHMLIRLLMIIKHFEMYR